ncbi:MAG: helix-turn-helix domain-containing protein [Candidatus Methylacidiphilales bacterium]
MVLRETHIIGEHTREWLVHSGLCHPLRPLSIPHAGLSSALPPYCMVRHKPPHLHVLVCIGGKGEVWMDDDWKECCAGQAYVSPPGVFTAFRAIPETQWDFIWIYYAPLSPVRMGSTTQCTLQKTDTLPFECSMRGLLHEAQTYADEPTSAMWAGLLHSASLRLLEPSRRRYRLHTLWQEVEGHPALHWTMKMLAERAGFSEEHLRRLSLGETGRSPMHQVAHIRMQKAAMLLQTTQLTVAAISEVVGYDNPYAFSTAFKRHMGVPPSQYIKAAVS